MIVNLKRRHKRLKRLWFKYCRARNELFDFYWIKWARGVAKMFSSISNINFEDIETDAALGLIKAIETNRIPVTAENEYRFKKYATNVIRTSIIDGIRSLKGIDRKPKLSKIGEVSKEKNINHARIHKVKEEIMNVMEYVKTLEPFERNLIYRKYFLGETLVDISKDLGMSHVTLSIKCKEIVKRLVEQTGVEKVP